MHSRLARGRFHTLLVAALVGSLSLAAVPSSSVAGPAPAGPERTAATSAIGSWDVVRTGAGTYQVSWRSPRRLPVTSDRARIVLDGVPIGVPLLRADGRTVVTTVRSAERPDVADLDVLLSGDRLDHAGVDETGDSGPATTPRLSPQLADDPAEPGEYDVVRDDYELPPVKLPRMRDPIEMVGHIVEPDPAAVTGPRPLVLFLHGRHSYCYNPTEENSDAWEWPCQAPFEDIPSHLGYDYMQQVLASQGFATVSIRVNGINAQDYRLSDGGADARAQIVQEHLDHWTDKLAADHQVDLSRVVLVGHSRGGEGVNRASIQIPLDAPYRIVGQVLLAPTDFGTQTAPYVPTVTVLPYCDGDVSDLQGQRFTDSARDLTTNDTSLKSSVMVLGANHNFFNTEWTPGIAQAPSWDDWYGRGGVCGSNSSSRLSAGEQRQVGIAYVAGAVQLFAADAQEFLPLFDGSVVHPPSIGAADVRSHAIGGGRELRRPAIDTGLSLPSGADTSFCQGVLQVGSSGACGREFDLWGQVPHWYNSGEFAPARRELELTWSEPGQTGGLVFDDPLDLSSGRLELRTIVDPTLGDARIRLRLTDANGDSAEITPPDDGMVRALPVDRQVGKRWAQSVIADPATATGIDTSQVVRLDVIGVSSDGRLWILDVAAAPDALVPVPEERLPLVSLGSLTIQEGDDPDTSVVRVPFTISGEVTRPAELTVGVLEEASRRSRSRIRVDLAPGQTEGYLRYEYTGNDVDDYPRRGTGLYAFAVSGVMTDKYDGRVTLVDDDPAPELRIRTPKRVSEGATIRIKIALTEDTGYDSFVSVQAVRGRGPGHRLAVGDLPSAWLDRHYLDSEDPADPLHKAGLYLYDRLRPGQRTGEVTLPIRVDSLREGTERVSFRIYFNRQRVTRTIRVVD
jgi:dienelactone hydrolase